MGGTYVFSVETSSYLVSRESYLAKETNDQEN